MSRKHPGWPFYLFQDPIIISLHPHTVPLAFCRMTKQSLFAWGFTGLSPESSTSQEIPQLWANQDDRSPEDLFLH